jgi:hypothetical protein
MARVSELIDELKQDIKYELIETDNWELREAYIRTIQRLEEIRAVAVRRELRPVAKGEHE